MNVCRDFFPGRVWWVVVSWVVGAGPLAGEGEVSETGRPVFKRYNLSCLAPLLENLNAEAPKTLDEAFLRGPVGVRSQTGSEGLGVEAVHFPITTEHPAAQAHFRRGIALLHTMWYREAERAFRCVVQVDPGCAMGYWGLALANEQRPGRARFFAAEAVNKTNVNRPVLEQRWIEIIAQYYQVSREVSAQAGEEPGQDTLVSRSAARIRALEDLVMEFPDDVEAKAFLLRQLTLDKYRVGLPLTSHLGVEQLATELAEASPRHPSRHYAVLLWLDRRPGRALPAADLAPTLSPSVAEVWRYASEAYADAGRMEEAILLYEASVRTDHDFLVKNQGMPWQSQNLAANHAVLVEALMEMGRTTEAVQWARRAARMPRPLDSKAGETAGEFPARAHRQAFRALAMVDDWEGLLKEVQFAEEHSGSRDDGGRAERLFWRGLAHLFLDQPEHAATSREEIGGSLKAALQNGVSNQVESSITSVREDLDASIRLLDEGKPESLAAKPGSLLAPWLVVKLYEKAGLVRHAAAAAQLRAVDHPHRLLPVAEHCRLAHATGNKREAFFHLNRRLRTQAARADENLPPLKALDAIAEEMQLPRPWTLDAPVRRPPALPGDLASLGPVEWAPSPAPPFRLPDHAGTMHDLSGFAGKPVVLNFFLGVTCPFCVKQINTFKPVLPAFREAGIEFVAVSTDPVAVLKKRFADGGGTAASEGSDFPFLVLADPELEVFQSYRAYDEFDDGPLHATVLLDGRGRLLWADRGHAPFNTPEGLLHEAQRLLGLHAGAE